MRVEHRQYTAAGKSKLVHRIDTDETFGFVEIVFPNGQRVQLEDSGGTETIEVRLVPGSSYNKISVEPVSGNTLRLRASER